MNKLMSTILLAGIAQGCAPTAGSPRNPASVEISPELIGRVAGTPMACVNSRDLGVSRRITGDRILFETKGSLVYVNDTVGGCPGLTRGRALSTSTQSGRLCDGDVARVFDRLDGLGAGNCALTAFVPYRRSSDAD